MRNMCVSVHPSVSLRLPYESGRNHSAAGLGQTDVQLVLPHCPTDVRAVLLGARVKGTHGKGILLRYRSARISAQTKVPERTSHAPMAWRPQRERIGMRAGTMTQKTEQRRGETETGKREIEERRASMKGTRTDRRWDQVLMSTDFRWRGTLL